MGPGIDPNHLRYEVVRPVLREMGMWSEAAENLLIGTAAHESLTGRYLRQIRGPARGLYQMEPATHVDLLTNYLRFRDDLRDKLTQFLAKAPGPVQQLSTNLAYATAAARLQYWRVPEPLPAGQDIIALASYYKRHWNTFAGKATEFDFVRAFRKLPAYDL